MSLKIRQAIRRFLVGEDGIAGSALLELTIIAPLLVITSIYTMDFGLLFYKQMQVQNAAQAAVNWAVANHIYNNAAITAAVAAATNANPSVSVSTGYPIERCGCPSSTGVTFTSNTAPAPCPLCSGATGGLYATIQTEVTWNSFIRYGLFSSASRTLTSQASARIQ